MAAVKTGIYCRSVCPAPFARPNNIQLFPCAAAAEAAGYRPCRRCHPECSPETPAWLGTSAVVSRALRLIWEGALGDSSLDQLAGRVGIGSRQLRRLFLQHLGVPPIKIATTHRVHFARNLIEQTEMPMAEIALNAGYKSVRQFNHALRTIAGQSPTVLRRQREGSTLASRPGEFSMRLQYRPPLDWATLLEFLGPRATPGVESIEANTYRRTIESDGAAGAIEVRQDWKKSCLVLRVALPKYRGLLRVVERVRRVFDLSADPLQISIHLSRDPRLKPLLEARPGLRVPGAWDGFEIAVRAILGQRLPVPGSSGAGSSGVARRLVCQFGRRIDTPMEGLTHLFPRPEDITGADLTAVGISRRAARAIQALARALCGKQLAFEALRTLPEALTRLTAIEGIDEEMAHYIAMRACSEPDAFPSGEQFVGTEEWRPWRAYAAMHLYCGKKAVR